MSSIQRVGDLEIGQDLEFQRREWIAERVGWALMMLALLLALSGLFSVGPLSAAVAGKENDLIWMRYDRFARFKAPYTLQVHVAGSATSGEEVRLWLSRDYLEAVQIERIIPEPATTEVEAERVTYVFKVAEPGDAVVIDIYLQPEQIKPLSGQVGLTDGPTHNFTQLVYP